MIYCLTATEGVKRRGKTFKIKSLILKISQTEYSLPEGYRNNMKTGWINEVCNQCIIIKYPTYLIAKQMLANLQEMVCLLCIKRLLVGA